MGVGRRVVVPLAVSTLALVGCIGGGDDEQAFCDLLADDLLERQFDGVVPDAIVFMSPDASDADIDGVRSAIDDDTDVVSSAVVSQEEAYDEFVALFGDTPEMIEAASPENLPSSIRVDLVDGSPNGVGDWSGRVQDAPGVFSVASPAASYPMGSRVVDAVIQPLSDPQGVGVSLVVWGDDELLDELAESVPDDLAEDVEVVTAALGASSRGGIVEVTPEASAAAQAIVDHWESECASG